MPAYNELMAIANNTLSTNARLSGDSRAFLINALGESLERLYTWSGSGQYGELSAAEQDTVEAITAKALRELMIDNNTGTVFACAGNVPDGALACDGSQYNRVDYPALYAVLDAVFVIDADTFAVPDLRDRMVVGIGIGYVVGDTGGETTHTLTTDEIPSHSHSVGIPDFSALVVAPGEAPVPAIDLLPSATGNTGGGQSHNNMPPYLALRWAIWT